MNTLVLPLKEELKSGRQTEIVSYEAHGKPERLTTALRQLVDRVLTQAWRACGMPEKSALVAVGGYGRGELFPYSDVDVLILLAAPPDAREQAQLEEMVQLLWDLGLEIGHSIRTVAECLSESAADITVQTSLLEARLVTGNRALFGELVEQCRQAMDPQAFFEAKILELHQRHAKYEDTPYSL